MLFALICKDKPGQSAGAARHPARPRRLPRRLNAEGTLKFAGPFLDDDGKPCGSLVVIEAADEAAAAGDRRRAIPMPRPACSRAVEIQRLELDLQQAADRLPVRAPKEAAHELLAVQIRTVELLLRDAEEEGQGRHAMGRRAQLRGAQQHAGHEDRRSRLLLPFERGAGRRRHRRGLRAGASGHHDRRRALGMRRHPRRARTCRSRRRSNEIKANPKLAEMALVTARAAFGAAGDAGRMEGSLPHGRPRRRRPDGMRRGARPTRRRALHPRQHGADRAAACAGDPAASRRRGARPLAADRGGACRDRPAAALLGLCLGRRPGAGALRARPSRTRARQARARFRHRLRAWSPSRRPRPARRRVVAADIDPFCARGDHA